MPEIKGRRTTFAADAGATVIAQAPVAVGSIVRVDGKQSHSGHSSRRRGTIEMSPRQEQVLRLLSQGMTDKEVARELDISPRTVQTHMKNFLAKNRIRTRLEAVATWSCHVCRGD